MAKQHGGGQGHWCLLGGCGGLTAFSGDGDDDDDDGDDNEIAMMMPVVIMMMMMVMMMTMITNVMMFTSIEFFLFRLVAISANESLVRNIAVSCSVFV